MQRQIPILRERARLRNQQRSRIAQALKFRQVTKPKIRLDTKFPIFFKPTEAGEELAISRRLLGKIKQAYEVQVRRGGKFRTISTRPLPKGKALELGAKRTITTLAATFRLKKKGVTREKDVPYTPSLKAFRAPKTGEKLTYIERKPLRLKKGSGEIPEILGIRKQKGRRKNRLWF
jgi:hypothetical protein